MLTYIHSLFTQGYLLSGSQYHVTLPNVNILLAASSSSSNIFSDDSLSSQYKYLKISISIFSPLHSHWWFISNATDTAPEYFRSFCIMFQQYTKLMIRMYTVEPRYNKVLGTMKITLLYQGPKASSFCDFWNLTSWRFHRIYLLFDWSKL